MKLVDVLEFFVRKVRTVNSLQDQHGEIGSIELAIYLEKKAMEAGHKPNMTKIQKWLYICYGLYLAVYNKQLLKERPKAWDYGPAFPTVHKQQKKNGDSLMKIRDRIAPLDLTPYDNVIDVTLKYFGDWTASELVNWTHKKSTAWDKKFNYGERYMPLENNDILVDFKELVAND